jgi:hypothetical protein
MFKDKPSLGLPLWRWRQESPGSPLAPESADDGNVLAGEFADPRKVAGGDGPGLD